MFKRSGERMPPRLIPLFLHWINKTSCSSISKCVHDVTITRWVGETWLLQQLFLVNIGDCTKHAVNIYIILIYLKFILFQVRFANGLLAEKNLCEHLGTTGLARLVILMCLSHRIGHFIHVRTLQRKSFIHFNFGSVLIDYVVYFCNSVRYDAIELYCYRQNHVA